MTLVSRSVEMLLEKDPAGARDQLTQLRDLQREALAEMRALIFELRPGNLEQDGLVRALKTHAGALQGRLGLPIVVESDLTDRLPLPAEEVLYRIAQEALHNVVKHAAAHSVRVEVRREGPLSDCGSKTTARASTPPGSRTDISGSPGCVHARSASGRCSRARAHQATERRSRSAWERRHWRRWRRRRACVPPRCPRSRRSASDVDGHRHPSQIRSRRRSLFVDGCAAPLWGYVSVRSPQRRPASSAGRRCG